MDLHPLGAFIVAVAVTKAFSLVVERILRRFGWEQPTICFSWEAGRGWRIRAHGFRRIPACVFRSAGSYECALHYVKGP